MKKYKLKKKIKTIIIIILCIAVSCVFVKIKNCFSISDTPRYQLAQMIQENSDIQDIYDHYLEYPPELIDLLINDIDTLDFVKGYLQFKEHPTIPANIGKINESIPLLMQWDQRWGYLAYGDNCIAINGCGPTCLSMVICGLTRNNTITPYTVAKYALEHDYYLKGVGTKWALMTTGAKHFGIQSQVISLNQDKMIKELRLNHPLICSMKPGDFTTSGHFIVISEYKGGKFKVLDPNSKKRSQKLWTYKTLSQQINNIWSYSIEG